MKLKYRKAVFIVVYIKDNDKIKYLLLKRKLHWKGWEFPKGAIEKNESLIEAVKRELREETWQKPIKIKKFNLSGKYQYHKLLKDRPGFKGQSWKLFAAEVKNSKIKLDKEEHCSFRWLGFDNAKKLLKWQNQKRCLKIVDKFLENG